MYEIWSFRNGEVVDFLVVISSILVRGYHVSEARTVYIIHPKNEGSISHRNTGNHLPVHTIIHVITMWFPTKETSDLLYASLEGPGAHGMFFAVC